MSRTVAVTGGSGRLGRVLNAQLLARGDSVLSIDRAAPLEGQDSDGLTHLHVDLNDLEALTEAFRGCQAVVHLAAFTGPWGQPPGVVYANNTLSSYNVLYAASDLGILKVCLASSVNALGGLGSRTGNFDYFPIDEKHPTYNEDDYSLSKWVMEQQASSFARRFAQMTISSLRFHALPDGPPELQDSLDAPDAPVARNAWGWTLISEAARSCVLAIEASYTGHEVFYITAPYTMSSRPSLELAQHAFPDVPMRGDISGRRSFYDCSKAERLLGWKHADC